MFADLRFIDKLACWFSYFVSYNEKMMLEERQVWRVERELTERRSKPTKPGRNKRPPQKSSIIRKEPPAG